MEVSDSAETDDVTPIERYVDVADGLRLWAEATGAVERTPLLLVMGANASAATWPDEFVASLARHHRVIRYDHRDTGRSTWAFADRPYAIRDLATDAVAVLDAFEIDRAHVVGMSMGGVLVQLLLIDHPARLRSATLFCTTALGGGLAVGAGEPDVELPGPDPRLLAMWNEMGDTREPDAELAWRVEHWRLLNGDQLDFEPDTFRRMEQRVIDHAGRSDSPTAHASADQSGLERGGELAAVRTPTLVIEAPADPINPPPHAGHLASVIGAARMVTIPKMGHSLHPAVLAPLADAIVDHTTAVDAEVAPVS
jgi:pimeloyl-ACP methyl ester carboxylesterase